VSEIVRAELALSPPGLTPAAVRVNAKRLVVEE
jgi:hypothetical protein